MHVANDANTAAMGEYIFGESASHALLLVRIGRGVGTDTPQEARDHLEEEFETAYPETDPRHRGTGLGGVVDKLTTSLSAATARTSSRWATPRRWPSPSS